ncbi:SprT-like domain-containing protein [Caldithrix abyssi]
MTEADLQKISTELVQELTGKKKVQVSACFYKSKALNHKIKLDRGIIHIRIAEGLRHAPETIIRALIKILVLKLHRYKVERNLYKIYREYVDTHSQLLSPQKVYQPSKSYQAEGKVFNLNSLFDQLNEEFFQNKLQKPLLGWSLRKSYHRLAFYSAKKNLLVVSRIFDAKKVPQDVVKFLLYHEMLHIAIPVVKVNGRRRVHPPAFKQREKQFPQYEAVQKWIEKNINRL